MSPDSPWNDERNMRSHPPITEKTTSTMVVQRQTAASDTQAMRRLRRYLRMRWSLCMRGGQVAVVIGPLSEVRCQKVRSSLDQPPTVILRYSEGSSLERPGSLA